MPDDWGLPDSCYECLKNTCIPDCPLLPEERKGMDCKGKFDWTDETIGRYIDEWIDGSGERQSFVDRFYKAGVGLRKVPYILDILDTTCKYCYGSDDPCYCTRDD